MKTKVFLFVTLCFLISTQAIEAKERVKGNGNVVTKEIKMGDYKEIEMYGNMDVVYEQSTAAPYFEITVDENILPYLEIEVKGKKLIVQPKTESSWRGKNRVEINPTRYRIKTNSRELVAASFAGSGKYQLNNVRNSDKLKLDMAGSGRITIEGLTTKEFKLNVAGSGNTIANNVTVETLKASVAGSGGLQISGESKSANISVAGSGNIKAEEFIVEKLNASTAGSGSIKVNVTEELKASVAGSGNIQYKGHPKLNTSVSGSGRVKSMN